MKRQEWSIRTHGRCTHRGGNRSNAALTRAGPLLLHQYSGQHQGISSNKRPNLYRNPAHRPAPGAG